MATSRPFDLDTGNFFRDLIGAAGDTSGQGQAIGPKDVSIIIWIQAVLQSAWFDALAPYHPTAVGVHSRIPRRPGGRVRRPTETRTSRPCAPRTR